MIKEPFWILNKNSFQSFYDNNMKYPEYKMSLWELLKIWLYTQISFFIKLYFKKCDDSKQLDFGHFLGSNGYCLRCKKSIYYIQLERRLKKKYEK